MPTPWLTIVGIGEDGLSGLSATARDAVEAGEILVGGRRHLALVPLDNRLRLHWRSPLADTLDELQRLRPRAVTVLATGDPLWFGVGRLLLKTFPADQIRILPHLSAFQLAAARLGWSLEDVVCTSVHGRPLHRLCRDLVPGARLIALTDGGEVPALVARLLIERDLGSSRLWVLERLGGPAERMVQATAATLAPCSFDPLTTLAIEVEADAGYRPLPRTPGLPDDAFEHDGQLTKAEIRAATIAALAPLEGERLWDIGAGAGSIAIEWLRAGRRMRAVAIERDPARARRIGRNAERLGVPELEIVTGEAPLALDGLPVPDAIFIGGGIGSGELLESAYERLRPGGRLVANAVTINGEAALLAFQARRGGALTRLRVDRAEPVGGFLAWRSLMPVTQLVVVRPKAG